MKALSWAVISPNGILVWTIKLTRQEAIRAFIGSGFPKWRWWKRCGWKCSRVLNVEMAYNWKRAKWEGKE